MSWFGVEVNPDSKEFREGWEDAGKGRLLAEVLENVRAEKRESKRSSSEMSADRLTPLAHRPGFAIVDP